MALQNSEKDGTAKRQMIGPHTHPEAGGPPGTLAAAAWCQSRRHTCGPMERSRRGCIAASKDCKLRLHRQKAVPSEAMTEQHLCSHLTI